MSVKIEILGIPELMDMMEKKQRAMIKILPIAVRNATLYLHAQIKESIGRGVNAPVAVDTGRFLNSVDFRTEENNGIVFNDLEYAKFIEYGTSRMGSRPHFRNTAFVEQNNMKEKFAVTLGDALSWVTPTGKPSR
jgi:hypothetical protein